MRICNCILTAILSLIIGIVIGVTSLQVTTAQEQSQNAVTMPIQDLLNNLCSKNDAEKVRSYRSILNNHGTLIQGLLDIANQKPPENQMINPRALAIELLGKLKEIRAVPFLLENIELEYYTDTLSKENSCEQSLKNMDIPLPGMIISYLKDTPEIKISDRAINRMAYLLMRLHAGGDRDTREFWNNKTEVYMPYSYNRFYNESALDMVKRIINDKNQQPNLNRLLIQLERYSK